MNHESRLNFVLRAFYGTWDTDAALDATIRFLQRAKFSGIMLWGGYGHWESNHFGIDETSARAARVAEVTPRLKQLGFSVGLNIHTVGFTYSPADTEDFGFDYQMNEAGVYDRKIACPLSPGFRSYLQRLLTEFAVQSLDYIMLDDDLNYMVGGACYCPLHMGAFSRKLGRPMTREQWVEATRSPTFKPCEESAAWSRAQNGAFLGALKPAERSMRARAPKLRLGIMGINTWVCDYGLPDTHKLLDICRGPDRLPPLVRPSVATYWDWQRYAAHGASSQFSERFVRASLPKDVTQLIEMDCGAPWTVFDHGPEHQSYDVERCIATGNRGIAFLLSPDAPGDVIPDDLPYTRMLERDRPRWEAIAELVGEDPIFEGVDSRPASGLSTVDPRSDRYYGIPSFSLSRIGIPMAPTGECVPVLYGKLPWTVGADALPQYTARGGIVDAGAMDAIERIGSSAVIDNVRLGQLDAPAAGLLLTGHTVNGASAGRYVSNLGSFREDCRFKLSGDFAESDVISWWVDSHFRRVGPAEILIERGDRRWALLSHRIDQQTPERQLLVANPLRRPVFQNLCEWINRRPLPAVLRDAADVHLFCMRSPDGRRRVLTLVNSGFNRFDKLTLDLASLPAEDCKIRTVSVEGKIMAADVEIKRLEDRWRIILPASLVPSPFHVTVLAIEAKEAA